MSRFSDELLDLFRELSDDLDELEPWEIALLCEDPVFHMLCQACGARDWHKTTKETFDADELGVDPEEE